MRLASEKLTGGALFSEIKNITKIDAQFAKEKFLLLKAEIIKTVTQNREKSSYFSRFSRFSQFLIFEKIFMAFEIKIERKKIKTGSIIVNMVKF
jgi:hypothetical protein